MGKGSTRVKLTRATEEEGSQRIHVLNAVTEPRATQVLQYVRGDRRVASGTATVYPLSTGPCIVLVYHIDHNHRQRQVSGWTMARGFFNVNWELRL